MLGHPITCTISRPDPHQLTLQLTTNIGPLDIHVIPYELHVRYTRTLMGDMMTKVKTQETLVDICRQETFVDFKDILDYK